MSNAKDFKIITKARIKTVRILIGAGDWEGAAYMMGYVLECALKASICKALHLTTYPENTGNSKVDSYFMSHQFDQLLITSSMQDIFSTRGSVEDIFTNWSDFTKEYPGEWPSMRYDRKRIAQFDELKVKRLYNNLIENPLGIIPTITRKKRW